MEDGAKQRTVSACFDGLNAYVKVTGRANFVAAQPLRTFVGRLSSRNANHLLVDATDCESMDSTFIGVLTSAALDCRDLGIAVEIANATERVMQQIAGLGLSAFFRFTQGREKVMPADALRLLPLAREGGVAAASRVMLEAHEKLASANPDNAERFKDVIDELRKETV